MAVVATHLTTSGSETDATSYVTASITPTANRLVLVAVQSGTASGGAAEPTLSGCSMTWVVVNTITVATNRRLTVFRGLSSSPTTGALTIDFGSETQVRCEWSIVEFAGIVTTGANGADAIVQSATNTSTGSAAGITVTLAAFGNAVNATYGAAWRDTNAAITAGSGFTEEGTFAGSDSGVIHTEFKDTNDTSVDWTWATVTTNAAAIGTEIQGTTTSTSTSSSTTTSTTSTSTSTTTSSSTSTSTTSTSSSTSTTTSTSSSTSTTSTSSSTSTTSTSSSTSITSSSTSSSTSTTSTSSTTTFPFHYKIDHADFNFL